ncbi:hypothetical protein LTR78_008822 [Recurvomyces mirabilis]|uniref:Uncharacterized protein n=1 Tax=Recurvomyces mirabilis TaxID=574656 RepID=A0AAE0TTC0_9PEZI|nr:hypothetical protein LTR78_008822 [Recurvomyces mirabilis]KAK5160942.1 hypothetical protein LTS14_000735 [Recurvomyces mirabilis]
MFGQYGPAAAYVASDLSIPGIPTTLLPGAVLGDGEYGATSVYLANATNVITSLGQAFASPTPYAIWQDIGFTTLTPKFYTNAPSPLPTKWAASQCGVWQDGGYDAYVSGTWIYVSSSQLLPYTGEIGGPLDSDYIISTLGIQFAYTRLPDIAVPLATALPNQHIFVEMQQSPWLLGSNASQILKETP